MRFSLHRPLGHLALLLTLAASTPSRAQPLTTPPTSHPIYVSAEGAAHDDAARDQFRQAAAKNGLGPVETVDLPPLPKPEAPAALKAGGAKVRELAFDEGRGVLANAVVEATQTGAAGLNQEALCDVFLYLAMAHDRANWNELPEAGPPAAGSEAMGAYLQAATLCPQRKLYQRTFPPLARHRFEEAKVTVASRGQGTLVVTAPEDALVSVDGRPLAPAPVLLTLPFGEHFIRVERPGRTDWTARVPLSLNQLEIEPAAQPFRTFPDDEAAQHARRMGAAYALVAELKPGATPLLELRLVEVSTAKRIDSTRVPLQKQQAGGVHAAVMRLDEQARKREMRAGAGPTAAKPSSETNLQISSAPVRLRDPSELSPTQDPQGWARKRWPMLTAVGAVLLTTLVLSVVVAMDDQSDVQ